MTKNEIKVILIGDSGVGKTNIIRLAIGKGFSSNQEPSLTLSFSRKEIKIKNTKYILDLWDTIGQENLRTMNKLFYNNSRIVIFVYDITSRESFEDLNYWINEVSSQLGDEDIIRGIIGNKIDLYLQEAVNDNDVEKLTKKINGKYLRMSAKEDEPQKIENYLEELLSDYLKLGVQGDEKLIDLTNKSKNKIRKNCC